VKITIDKLNAKTMNITNIKQIIRSLIKRKLYTTINVIGLGIGLGCAILMATYIIHEFSYDRHYSDANRIFRVIDGKDVGTYYAMGEAFIKDVPEIEEVCRIFPVNNIRIKKDRRYQKEELLVLADPTVINFLDIKLIHGKKTNQLLEPGSIVISKSMAEKYFPGENAIGKEIEMAISQKIHLYQVSGVFKDLPSYSSLQTHFIGNIDNAFDLLWDFTYTLGFKKEKEIKNYKELWEQNGFVTFVKLNENSNARQVEEKCSNVCLNYRDSNKEEGGISLQPISQMYLHSDELEESGIFLTNRFESLKIFMGIGILILLVAIINFILISNADNNLSISEIACRKVNGASKRQIIFNSLFKSVLIAFISLVPAIVFVWLMIPVFNNLFDKSLHLALFLKWQYILSLVMITFLTGISAGLYLGLFVSNVNPASLFQKRMVEKGQLKMFKGSLVIVQFVVFILLSSCFLLMMKQYKYSLSKDLGLDTKNILAIDMNEESMVKNIDYIKNRVLSNPNVIDCVPTSFTSPPCDNTVVFSYRNSETGKIDQFEALVFGKGVIEMMDITILEGRTFNNTDGGFAEKFIINQKAAEKYDVKAGEKLDDFNIVGVVGDFHFHSLHEPIKPVFIAMQAENFHYMLIKTNGKNKIVADYTRNICHEIMPGFYMDYELLDDRITEFYKEEEKQMGTIGFFAGIALALSVLGLLGFVTLSLVKKTKDIGVRKINGANIKELIGLINLQYVKWIITAFIIACPIAYYAMGKWLEGFAYTTSMSWWVFGLAGIAALIFALVTVSLQSWRAANRNPVEALRYE